MSAKDQLSNVERLLHLWQSQPEVGGNIAFWQKIPPRPANYSDLPADLHPALASALNDSGYRRLYSHQAEAWNVLQSGKNVVVVTGTSSGKTLCYNLSIFDRLLKDHAARALYLFPTKALTQDQLKTIKAISGRFSTSSGMTAVPLVSASIYDGDTPSNQRSSIRASSRLLLTNPDMLHMGILPHHTLWAGLFQSLQFVVIDEIHMYRGIFGSHLANVIRRLKRILKFYGSSPLFVLTSATISNPADFAARLIEEPVELIDHDGSPRGERNYLLYNPPVVDRDLGLRASASSEAVRLARDLLAYNVQTILFARARRTVERILMSLRFQEPFQSENVRGYRSGYLPGERRQIEQRLRSGEAKTVIATNALELGIDIGGMDASVLVGYPGTIASTIQQFGRAGRRLEPALGVLVASGNPLDQYLIQHPEYIFDRSPEGALIDPNNLLILMQHLRCAAFELPFYKGEGFGNVPVDVFQQLLEFLAQNGLIHASGPKYFWMSDQYPADQVSLRSTDQAPVVLLAVDETTASTIGQVDHTSARWMVHPGAIYLHEGRSYLVDDLNLEENQAHLHPVDVDYYTDPQKVVTFEKISEFDHAALPGAQSTYGEILVTTQVKGFKRIRWLTNELLGFETLDLPPTQLRTTACWLALDESTQKALKELGLWRNDPNVYGPNWNHQRNLARQRDHYTCQVCGRPENGVQHQVHHKVPFRTFSSYLEANRLDNLITLCSACHQKVEQNVRIRSGLSGLSYVLHQLAPLFLMCDYGDLGSAADPQSPLADGYPTVVLYDEIPAGIGLSEHIFRIFAEIVRQSLAHVSSCGCKDGCPACVGPGGENGVGGKEESLAILSILSGNRLQDRNQ
ncbi:MAG TPA: DEAD/DEAH box helicase [Anaerolineaceae bacterium]|nr:DEAD/DEAH box helicase [Anaerolineaceae bacterium]